MKIAYVSSQKRGEADRLLSELADELINNGFELRGIVKEASHSPIYQDGCDMSVRVLPDGAVIKITQNLGVGSEACRLDPSALAEAVAQVEQSSFENADLFILNKFGPEECAGRGFRSVMGKALEHGVPVLVGVGPASIPQFQAFADGLAKSLPDDAVSLLDWCLTRS
ncbi:DUF2478 domain-containing protein [Ruegeria atlantica]|uniref:DUF2478 domain-containing protein n=1 Tax=Ruegeria atlantica TaxID=81569 RepID=UPI001480CD23|nr:DUF2478 domain-containing protein [Ruegeria atlantica]